MTDYTIKRYHPYSKEELIAALKEYAKKHQLEYVTSRDFCRWYDISPGTVQRHFGKG
jgi:UDP-N-acetylmuramoylalanine-D-glutamate ligase